MHNYITTENALLGKKVVFLGIILSYFFQTEVLFQGEKPLFYGNLRQTISLHKN